MGIYLPNIEIPKDTLLIAIGPDGTVDVHRNDELTWFTLKDKAVFVPQHGRLIDTDVLYEVVKKRTRNWNGGWSDIECVLTGNDIKNAPTVIEAEEG